MTVCIASYCAQAKSLLLASDTMISTLDMSADFAAFKFYAVGNRWIALYAGNDVGHVTPIIRNVRAAMRVIPDTLDNTVAAFGDAFVRELAQKAQTEVLQPFGYQSMEQFRNAGSREVGVDMFTRMLVEIQQQTIDVIFLVAGFDELGNHQIFTVQSPGRVSYYTEIGFWAIGSGQTNALGTFFNLSSRTKYCDLPTNLYRICEAKFNAENAAVVGKRTIVQILPAKGQRYLIDFMRIDDLRPHWEATKVDHPPEEAKKLAAELLKEAQEEYRETPQAGDQLVLGGSAAVPQADQTSEDQS